VRKAKASFSIIATTTFEVVAQLAFLFFSFIFLGSLAYKLSKAALDQLTRCTALEVQNKVSSFEGNNVN
jgi:hypothetical protein